MPFNPALPANNSPISSVELRSQFTGLKTLIDAVPAGVTQQQLDNAIGNLLFTFNDSINNLMAEINSLPTLCANNVDGIEPLEITIGNPPTQAQVQAVLDKLNELINGLHR
jgi:hypothetical protein